MTDTQTLREAVARAICLADGCDPDSDWNEALGAPRPAWMLYAHNADAAIATMFERLRTPSDGMVKAGIRVILADGGSVDTWQAMLDKFQQENSDDR